jgi:hypothetical protein
VFNSEENSEFMRDSFVNEKSRVSSFVIRRRCDLFVIQNQVGLHKI